MKLSYRRALNYSVVVVLFGKCMIHILTLPVGAFRTRGYSFNKNASVRIDDYKKVNLNKNR